MENLGVKSIVLGIVGAIFALIWWLALPALNIASVGLWIMIIAIIVVVAIALFAIAEADCEESIGSVISGWIAGILVVIMLLILFFNTPLFRAKSYASLYGENNITEKPMSEYFAKLDNIPLTDSDTADRLIIRAMGSLKGDMVSQFEAEKSYACTYNGKSYRFAPLKYAGFFQWMNNKDEGIPAYIAVDMTTQKTEIVYLNKPMKYSPSERFGRDLRRHLRSQYPCDIFYSSYFEVSEDGKPYWVTPVVDYKVGLFQGEDISHVIVTDAETGESNKYEVGKVPEWVDNVWPSMLIEKQYNWHGQYHSGFRNGHFKKKNVTNTTEGYNYVPDENDINLYTGITSLVRDESNIGFILVNKRTKQTYYYEYAGAEEYSAMDSAKGEVANFGYTATFPLLVNIEGEPTYYMALKDDAGLIKSYALVNVKDYDIAVADKTLEDTLNKYLNRIGKTNSEINVENLETENNEENKTTVNPYPNEITGNIEDVKTYNIDGNTYFYVKLVNNESYFKILFKDSEDIMFKNIGDEITILYNDTTEIFKKAKIK